MERTETELDDALTKSEERRRLARRRLLGLVGSGGLEDREALAVAEEAVHRALRFEASSRSLRRFAQRSMVER